MNARKFKKIFGFDYGYDSTMDRTQIAHEQYKIVIYNLGALGYRIRYVSYIDLGCLVMKKIYNDLLRFTMIASISRKVKNIKSSLLYYKRSRAYKRVKNITTLSDSDLTILKSRYQFTTKEVFIRTSNFFAPRSYVIVDNVRYDLGANAATRYLLDICTHGSCGPEMGPLEIVEPVNFDIK